MIREEEFYFDLEPGNDDQVDIVSPARGSLQSSPQPHGGSIEIFFTTRVQICDKSLQWSSTGGSLRPGGFDLWSLQLRAETVRAISKMNGERRMGFINEKLPLSKCLGV